MAARKRRGTLDKPWEDDVRKKIQTSMLINRLTAFVEGSVEMVPAQVTAALGLLKKTLPDLTAIEHSGEVTVPTVMRIPATSETTQAWQQQHTPVPNKTLQ